MVGLVMVGSLVAVSVVGVVVLVLNPAEPQQVVRWSALAIIVLVAAVLTPYTVDDSATAAGYLLGVPVVAAFLPVLAQWFGRLAGVADLVAAVVIIGWGLVLGLGVGGGAFLPVAVLFIGSGAASLSRPLSTTG